MHALALVQTCNELPMSQLIYSQYKYNQYGPPQALEGVVERDTISKMLAPVGLITFSVEIYDILDPRPGACKHAIARTKAYTNGV